MNDSDRCQAVAPCLPGITALAPLLERVALELEIANLYRAAERSHSKEDEQALNSAIGRRRRLAGPLQGPIR